MPWLWLIKLLGVDPASWIASFIKIFVICLPFLLSAGLMVGAYYAGKNSATLKCDNSKYEQVIQTQQTQINNLINQSKAYKETIDKLQHKNDALESDLNVAKDKVHTVVIDKRECDQGQGTIDLLNSLRSGQ